MGFFDDFIAGISSVVNAPLSVIEDFFSSTGIDDITDLPKAIYALANYIYQAAVSFGSLISNALIEVGQYAVQVGQIILGTLENIIESTLNYIVEGIYGLFSWMTDYVNSIYTGMRDSITEAMESMNTHVVSVASEIVSKAETLLVYNSMMGVLKGNVERGDFKLGKTIKEMAGAGVVSMIASKFFEGLLP